MKAIRFHSYSKLMLFVLALFQQQVVSAQNDKFWYFGNNNLGIEFTGVTPKLLENKMPWDGDEGSAVCTDPATGKLLFYTDGIKLFDREHKIMKTNLNGNADNLGSCISTANAAAICPMPGQCNKYLLFVNTFCSASDGEIRCYVVDLSKGAQSQKDGLPLGQVIKPTNHQFNFNTSEIMHIVPIPETANFRLLVKENKTKSFRSYLINSSFYTIQTNGNIVLKSSPTYVTFQFNNLPEYGGYMMSFNSKKSKIALTCDQKIYTFNYNPNSGIGSNLVTHTSEITSLYGVEWSENGELVYATTCRNGPELYQLQIATNNLIKLHDMPGTLEGLQTEIQGGGIIRATNGKIYILLNYKSDDLGVINDPNSPGTACGFQETGFLNATDVVWDGINLPKFLALPSVAETLPKPSLTITPVDPEIGPGQTQVDLTASGAPTTSYYWIPTDKIGCQACPNPFETLSCSMCPKPTVNSTTTTEYTVTAFGANGCSTTKTVTVLVTPYLTCKNCTDGVFPKLTTANTTLANKVYCVNEDVVVERNLRIINCELKMSEQVKIIVKPKVTLTIEGSHLYACDKMWEGIIVEPGGRLIIRELAQLAGLANKSALIEDARTAVFVQPFPPFGTPSSITYNILDLTKVIFNKNNVGIYISDFQRDMAVYPFKMDGLIFTSRNLQFFQNTLQWPNHASVSAPTNLIQPLQNQYISNTEYAQTGTASDLKSPMAGKPVCGIYLKNVGLTLNANSNIAVHYELNIGTTGNFNLFDNLTTAIIAENTNVTSTGNVFQNGVAKGGVGIRAFASDISALNRLRILPYQGVLGMLRKNSFVNIRTCVTTVDYFNLEVLNADFRSAQSSANKASAAGGISIQTNRFYDYKILDCDFTNLNYGIAVNVKDGNIIIPNTGITTPKFGKYFGFMDFSRNDFFRTIFGAAAGTQFFGHAVIVEGNGTDQPLFYPNGRFGECLIRIDNNVMQEVSRGILVQNLGKRLAVHGYQYLSTCDNVIQLVRDPFNTISEQYGVAMKSIHFDDCFNERNEISSTINKINPNEHGIFLDTYLTRSRHDCNQLTNTYKGASFYNKCNNHFFFKNTFSGNKYGLALDFNAAQLNLRTYDGQIQAAENEWIGSTWSATGTINGNYKTACFNGVKAMDSPMYVNDEANENPENSSVAIQINTNQFRYTNSATFRSINYTSIDGGDCPNFDLPPLPDVPGILKDLELDAIGGLPRTYFPEITKVLSQFQLAELLQSDPSWLDQSSVLADFYTEQLVGNTGKLLNVKEFTNKGFWQVAQASLGAIVSENELETNLKRYYQHYITYMRDSTLNESDSTDLLSLANDCPFLYGSAVYGAQSLYRLVYNSVQVFESNCPENLERPTTKGESSTISFDALLYPNPTLDGVIYVTPTIADQDYVIDIYDLSGIKISSEVWNANQSIPSVLHVQKGTYLVSLTNTTSNEQITKKIHRVD